MEGLFDFLTRDLFGDFFGMQGAKLVGLPEGPYPGYPHMDGMVFEFSREYCQMKVFDIVYGLEVTRLCGRRWVHK